MFLTHFSLRNPIALTLFYVLLGIAGLLALARMQRSILPPISLPVVSISAPYAGAGPREMERLVIEPIEEQLASVPGVSRVNASAQSGIAAISIQFQFGTNIESARANVRQAVDAARQNLPADLPAPVVSTTDPSQAPVLEEAVSSVLISQTKLAQLVDRNMVPALRSTTGVGSVQTSGEAVREFIVQPQAAALDALGGTGLDVLRAVAAGNDLFPGGSLRTALQESSVGIDASVTSAAQIAALPVSIPGAGTVRVGEVARAYDGLADASVIARADGENAVLLYVSPEAGADPMRVIGAARAAFARLSRQYPAIRFEELRTDAPATNAAIAGVLQTLGEGIVLTVLVMLFFLHAWRNALIAAISIPSSLCAAFVSMWALGFSLNVLSLMGLSLTIGILVDDSIVIIEAIARAVQRGLRADDAALAGRKELGGAAFAITLVDVVVFAPIGLMSGIVGEFMREFALVIVFATAFSLLVSFTLTPLLSARWALAHRGQPLDGLSYAAILKSLQSRARTFPWTFRNVPVLAVYARWHSMLNGFNAWEQRIAQRYAEQWLPAAMKRRAAVFAGAIGACVLSLFPLFAGMIPAEFTPPVNRGGVSYDVVMPPGTPLTRTDTVATQMTDALLDDPAIAHVQSSAGRSFNGSTDVFASNLAQLRIVLADAQVDESEIDRRVRALQALAPSARIIGGGKGMGGLPAVSYTIAGDSSAIDAAAAKIAAILRANPDAADVRTSDLGLQPRLNLTPVPGALALLGVSQDDAAQTARIATGGSLATKARLSSGLVDVVVRSDAPLYVRSSNGVRVPLDDVMRAAPQTQPVVLEREDGRRVVSVTANPKSGVPISLLTAPVKQALRDPNFLPSGVSVQPRGDIEQFLDTVSLIFTALAFSLLAVYVILAILYRSYILPFVVMLTVPFASIGALGGLFVLNVLHTAFPDAALFQAQTLNLYSMLGIVMLVGLVAKNGILLVDYAERAVREGTPPAQAVVLAGKLRFRPILMTTLAMISGMLPLALGHTVGAEYRKALGSVVIGGLSTSFFLTLFVVPLAYVIIRDRISAKSRTHIVASRQAV